MKCETCFFYRIAKLQCHRFPRVYEKNVDDFCGEWRDKNAGKEQETKTDDGHCGTSPIETLQEKPIGRQDEQGAVERFRLHQGERIAKKEEKTVRKRGWPKGKSRKR
jgi:hypothetical protein